MAPVAWTHRLPMRPPFRKLVRLVRSIVTRACGRCFLEASPMPRRRVPYLSDRRLRE